MNNYLKCCSNLLVLNRRYPMFMNNAQRFQHILSTKAVTLAEDVYNPLKEATDSDRCLIIAHGLFGSRTNWRSLAKVIRERENIKVVTVDMRNHGDSPHTVSMTYLDMAADLVKVIEKHKTSKTILMGHSMGGKAAMLVTLDQPKLVRKQIIVDIAPTTSASAGEMPFYTRVLLNNLHHVQNEKDIASARRAMDAILQNSAESLRQNKNVRDFLLMLIAYDQNSGQLVWRANLEVIEEYINDIMLFPTEYDNRTSNVDTLFIAGAKSNYINEQSYPYMRKFFPSHRLIRIPNAGHWVHSERPYDFLNCVLPELKV